jgi:hypothetical protein
MIFSFSEFYNHNANDMLVAPDIWNTFLLLREDFMLSISPNSQSEVIHYIE